MSGGFYGNNKTPASNTTVGGVASTGSSDPNLIDNLIQELAAQAKQFVLDTGASQTFGGTADALTLTLESTPTTLYNGFWFRARIASNNTGAVTVNVNSIGSKKVRKSVAGVETALSASDLVAGEIHDFYYREAWDSSAGAFEVKGVSGGATIPYTGASSSGAASLQFAEDTDNGTSKATLKGAASLAGDIDVVLPSIAGDIKVGGTAAEFRSNGGNKAAVIDEVWSAAAVVTLTDAATITVDMSTFFNAQVTLAGNRALGNPTNPKVGQSGFIRVIQDAVGGRTLTFGSNYDFAGGTAPTITATANAVTVLFYTVLTSTSILITSALDVK